MEDRRLRLAEEMVIYPHAAIDPFEKGSAVRFGIILEHERCGFVCSFPVDSPLNVLEMRTVWKTFDDHVRDCPTVGRIR